MPKLLSGSPGAAALQNKKLKEVDKEPSSVFKDDVHLQKLLSYIAKHPFRRGHQCSPFDQWLRKDWGSPSILSSPIFLEEKVKLGGKRPWPYIQRVKCLQEE